MRNVPIIAKLAFHVSGFIAQFGWAFGGFGTLFFWLLMLHRHEQAIEVFPLLIVSIFPLVGFSLAACQIPTARMWIRLLERGTLVIGEYDRKEASGVSINDDPLYNVYYTFETTEGTKGEAAGSTLEPEAYSRVQQRQILYNPENSEEAEVLDDLPNGLSLNHLGAFEVKSIPYRLFILPGVTLVWNAWALQRTLFPEEF